MRTKENTLYLPIKQIYFDEILAGTKKQEYREIKDTTFKKYLEVWTDKGDSGIVFDDELISEEEFEKYGNDPFIYNGGVYPYVPIEYEYLDLRVGYAKDRESMIVEVTDISFELMKNKKGEIVRFDDEFRTCDDGGLTLWQIVYHLGAIVETDLKKDR